MKHDVVLSRIIWSPVGRHNGFLRPGLSSRNGNFWTPVANACPLKPSKVPVQWVPSSPPLRSQRYTESHNMIHNVQPRWSWSVKTCRNPIPLNFFCKISNTFGIIKFLWRNMSFFLLFLFRPWSHCLNSWVHVNINIWNVPLPILWQVLNTPLFWKVSLSRL